MIPGFPAERGSRVLPEERRSAPRFPFKAPAYLVDADSNARVISRVSDINLGGCHIDAVTCLPVGAAVWLRLTYRGESFTTKADVVAARDEMGMNLSFFSPEPEQLWIVKKWVDTIRQKQADAEALCPPRSDLETALEREPNEILKYLILMLVQKSVLNDAEGRILLKKLLGS